MNAYQQLLQKLDAFIDRFYLNQVIRGLLLLATLLLSSYLLVAGTAFYMQLPVWSRAMLFYAFVGGNLWLFIRWVLLPWGRMRGWFARMSYRKAAAYIGTGFPEVGDKLLNTIELSEYSADAGTSHDLLVASIEQRTWQLQPLPFLRLIDVGQNRRYLKYLLPVAGAFVFVLFAAPGVITRGGEQVLRYNMEFAPLRPFDFITDATSWQVEAGSDLSIGLQLKGKELPKEVQVEWEGFTYRMDQVKPSAFAYTLRNLQSPSRVRFKANKFYSDWFEIKVLPRPVIDRFDVRLKYPAYLNKAAERLVNTGDLVVPAGTQVEWIFNSQGVDSLYLMIGENRLNGVSRHSGVYSVVHKAMKPSPYQIVTSNALNPNSDTLAFGLQVIPDAWPTMEVAEAVDSMNGRLRYFSGDIGDDYGFSKLEFVYELIDADGKVIAPPVRTDIRLATGNRQRFFHYFDAGINALKDGASVNYYFELWDNDGVNGPKKVRSEQFTFRSLTKEETKVSIDQNASDVQQKLEGAVKDAKKLQKDLADLRKKLKEGKPMSWEDKQALEGLKVKQQQLQQNLEEATEKMEQNKALRADAPKEQDLLEKQQRLQEMAEKLLTDDIKKMMEELQRLMEQMPNKDKLQQQLENMQIDQKEVEKELDRMLAFFKALEVEQRANEVANELESLSKKQEELRQQTGSKEALLDKQNELNESFDALKERLDELEEMNKELEDPNDFGDLKEQGDEIQKQMDQAAQELAKGQKQKAAAKQQQSSEQMKKMAQKMRDQMQQSDMQMLQENIQALRMLLENLVKFSFNQEALMDRLQENSNYSPVYVEIGKEQAKLREEAKLIEDSLTALSKRVIQLESTISREMAQVNDNLQKAVEGLGTRQTAQAKTRQQYAMTAVNNLAVLLSELLKNMQEEMAQKMDGDQQCQKPGGASPSKLSKMSQMQKALNQQMQQMREKMEGQKGKDPGGKQGRNGEMSQGFAEMVAKQEAIRRELQKMSQEYGHEGKEGLGGELEKLAKEMEKTERDLVNKVLGPESLRRQEEIMTRLLQAEKAEREREFDDQRESNTAKDVKRLVPPGFEAYKRQQQRSLEMYKSLSPELNAYYKQKVDRYFLQLNP